MARLLTGWSKPTAPAACAAALAAQRALAGEAWGVVGAVLVRMALHTCVAVPEDGDYRTGALNRRGRLLGAVHGGQIVRSRATADLGRDTLPPDVTLHDLGERQRRSHAFLPRLAWRAHADI